MTYPVHAHCQFVQRAYGPLFMDDNTIYAWNTCVRYWSFICQNNSVLCLKNVTFEDLRLFLCLPLPPSSLFTYLLRRMELNGRRKRQSKATFNLKKKDIRELTKMVWNTVKFRSGKPEWRSSSHPRQWNAAVSSSFCNMIQTVFKPLRNSHSVLIADEQLVQLD